MGTGLSWGIWIEIIVLTFSVGLMIWSRIPGKKISSNTASRDTVSEFRNDKNGTMEKGGEHGRGLLLVDERTVWMRFCPGSSGRSMSYYAWNEGTESMEEITGKEFNRLVLREKVRSRCLAPETTEEGKENYRARDQKEEWVRPEEKEKEFMPVCPVGAAPAPGEEKRQRPVRPKKKELRHWSSRPSFPEFPRGFSPPDQDSRWELEKRAAKKLRWVLCEEMEEVTSGKDLMAGLTMAAEDESMIRNLGHGYAKALILYCDEPLECFPAWEEGNEEELNFSVWMNDFVMC